MRHGGEGADYRHLADVALAVIDSSPQIATMISGGTPNRFSIRASSEA